MKGTRYKRAPAWGIKIIHYFKLMYKRLSIFSFLILVNNIIHGQELLVNPSFEDYSNLIPDILDVNFCAKGWLTPNFSSIDYYNENFPVNIYGKSGWVPENNFGYHPAYDGIAYIGLVLYDWSGEMEYITGSLKQPLIKDSTYSISLHIRYAGDSVWIYSKSLELFFSKESKVFWWDTNYRLLYSHGFNQTASVKIDIEKAYITKDWLECTCEYKALGGEKFVTLGLFYQGDNFTKLCEEYVSKYNDFEKQKKFINTHDIYPIYVNKNFKPDTKNRRCVYAYYFIDDVSIKLKDNEVNETTYPKTDVPEK